MAEKSDSNDQLKASSSADGETQALQDPQVAMICLLAELYKTVGGGPKQTQNPFEGVFVWERDLIPADSNAPLVRKQGTPYCLFITTDPSAMSAEIQHQNVTNGENIQFTETSDTSPASTGVDFRITFRLKDVYNTLFQRVRTKICTEIEKGEDVVNAEIDAFLSQYQYVSNQLVSSDALIDAAFVYYWASSVAWSRFPPIGELNPWKYIAQQIYDDEGQMRVLAHNCGNGRYFASLDPSVQPFRSCCNPGCLEYVT